MANWGLTKWPSSLATLLSLLRTTATVTAPWRGKGTEDFSRRVSLRDFSEVHPVLGSRTHGLERQSCLLRAAPGAQVSPVLSCVLNIFSRLRSRGISAF